MKGKFVKRSQNIMKVVVGKFNIKVNVIPNGLKKYISLTISNKLSFINSFQLLSFPLDSLGKNLNKD